MNHFDNPIQLTEDTPFKVGNKVFVFRRGTEVFHENGIVKGGVLAAKARLIVGGRFFHFAADEVNFYANGQIRLGYLAGNTTVRLGLNEIVFGQDTRIFFSEDGSVNSGVLAEPALLKVGVHARETEDTALRTVNDAFMFNCRLKIETDAEGKIKDIGGGNVGVSAGGRIFRAAADSVQFDSIGQIKSGYLAADSTVRLGPNEFVFGQGTLINFYDGGHIHHGDLADQAIVKVANETLIFKEGTTVEFYENGHIHRSNLARQATVQVGNEAFTFHEGAALKFYENGPIKEGTLASDTQVRIGGRSFPLFAGYHEHMPVRFYPAGQIRSGYLAEEMTVRLGPNEIVFGQKTEIGFYEDGSIRDGAFADEMALLKVGSHEMYFCGGIDWYVYTATNHEFYHNLRFHPNGNIMCGMLFKEAALPVGQRLTIMFSAYSNLHFYENGAVACGWAKAFHYVQFHEECLLTPNKRYFFDEHGGLVDKKYVCKKLFLREDAI